jgi:peptide/nickel transport system permease protein
MFGYIVRRIISGLLVLFIVSVSVFVLFFAGPNDPATAYCPETKCTPSRLSEIKIQLGLNQPVVRQYGQYMKGIFVGRNFHEGGITIKCPAPCLGVSFKLRLNVWNYLRDAFPATLSIAVGAVVLFLSMGLVIGVLAARNRGTTLDRGLVSTSLVINAFPYYLVALLTYLLFINKWGLLPDSGYFSPFHHGPIAWAKGMLAAWLVLGIVNSTAYARFSRGSMIEALNEDFVRTARAKGLSERRVSLKHALRAAIVPVVTIFGLDLAGYLAGTLITEYIFNIQGIGVASLAAVKSLDLPIIAATVLFAAFLIVVLNLVVDLIYSVIDPRVRLT